jgi:hypothetical protein
MTHKLQLPLAAAALLAIPAVAPGQSATTASTPAPGSLEETLQEIKNPTSWMSWGGDLRVRNEYFNNLLTLDSQNPLAEQEYLRFRARVWTSLKPIENVTVNARLATEPREWFRRAGYTPYRGQSGWDWTDGVIDNLNVQWKNILDQPLSLIVGRQDLMLGEGWLTGEGTPYDGSWTYYMDAARLSYELKEQKTLIEAIGILQNAEADAWLPVINNQNRFLSEQDETGAILNIVNTSLPYANFNPYFIYKHDDRAMESGAPQRGDNADIYTFGARISGLVKEHWKYSVEGAYQFGEKQDPAVRYPAPSTEYRDLNAFGVNSKLTYLFKDRLNNQLSFSYEYLTGDDPDTADDEMFDGLWARYPRWGEIGLYSFAAETRVGQQANYHRFGPSWTITPAKGLDFTANYYAMIADQDTPTRAAPGLFTNDDAFRGHFVSTILKYKFGPRLAGHLWAEFLFPGDYYANSETLTFLRAEVLLTF